MAAKRRIHTQRKQGPTLDPERQVSYLASRGVTFDHISQKDAARYLRDVGGFMRTSAYKSLFPKQAAADGTHHYLDLDFAYLVDLAEIDHVLRHTFLPVTLDVEQSAKLSLLYTAHRHNEEPYDLVDDYFASISSGHRARLTAELEARRGDADIYSGELINKYVGDMPVWVIAEVLDFGDFLDLCDFCAERWSDTRLTEVNRLLRDIKELRNACAHGSCVLNGIGKGTSPFKTPAPLVSALSGARLAGDHELIQWTTNPRTLEMLAALWGLHELVRSDARKEEAREGFKKLLDRAQLHAEWYAHNELLCSCYRFFERIIVAWAS